MKCCKACQGGSKVRLRMPCSKALSGGGRLPLRHAPPPCHVHMVHKGGSWYHRCPWGRGGLGGWGAFSHCPKQEEGTLQRQGQPGQTPVSRSCPRRQRWRWTQPLLRCCRGWALCCVTVRQPGAARDEGGWKCNSDSDKQRGFNWHFAALVFRAHGNCKTSNIAFCQGPVRLHLLNVTHTSRRRVAKEKRALQLHPANPVITIFIHHVLNRYALGELCHQGDGQITNARRGNCFHRFCQYFDSTACRLRPSMVSAAGPRYNTLNIFYKPLSAGLLLSWT